MIMDVVRKKRIKRDWAAVFAEFDRSAMTIKEFCRSQGMSQSLFYRRRKDHNAAEASKGPALGRGDFVELKPVSSFSRSASISFPGSIELSISNDCDRDLLRTIISQLKGSLC
jgi:hypothetical protein